MKPSVLVVAGPTASGKTALGVALAKRLGGEVISADSMQIYRHMAIATAAPTKEETQGIAHHLIGFLEPWEPFSAAKYQALCLQRIEEIRSRGKLPILVGGSGLYINTVVDNTSFLDCEPTSFRASLAKQAEKRGGAAMLEELRKVDPETASHLHENDLRRILRALELYYATGETMTRQRDLSHLKESPYAFCILGLDASDRKFLYDRINRRVDLMLEAGLLEEAKAFFNLPQAATAKQAIGYKELAPYFNGTCSLEEAIEKLKMETRRYAKRQLTWFRKRSDVHWLMIDQESKEDLVNHAVKIYEAFLGENDEAKSS